MIKHVGRIGDRKVAVVFREVPNEDHMALVLYTETLPAAWHDAVMKVIEDAPAQNAENLGDVLFRSLLPDGRAMLETFHVEGMIKKVQTQQVLMTPSSGHAGVRLDELNKIINEIKAGGDAAQKMADLDANAGLANKPPARDVMGRRMTSNQQTVQPAGTNVALDDTALANNLLNQAQKMETEAKGLLAEAARIKKEAESMLPKPQRGRSKKAVMANAPQ